MKIALYGTGRMGRAIEEAALRRGHAIALKVGSANAGTPPTGCDVAIEFSRPAHAVDNIRLCVEAGVPAVVGTTGWNDRLPEVRELVNAQGGAVLWASNFSIGVNLFFRINRLLAGLMDGRDDYRVRLDEVHHVHKLDAPSGTAITLARDIDLQHAGYTGWSLAPAPAPSAAPATAPAPASPAVAIGEGMAPATVPIHSERTGEVPGKHSVQWTSADDRIIITHEAFGRGGFATGAVLAAEWLADPVHARRGLFTMDDVLGRP
ncbi:MAG TPA: dihydrodipicolinate reductase C-terminal domain-containing protein [Flavobacteriales bacterium]|nr:dihydrodipicolinate reductase C-terminal domain-containing protein [Flavobacteriales bacterium]HMR26458.1 dihydrodipicolinate reductase C-terminal domain-containing protein [Flavobacteriales bacterium]